jgi:hypothetical protein
MSNERYRFGPFELQPDQGSRLRPLQILRVATSNDIFWLSTRQVKTISQIAGARVESRR